VKPLELGPPVGRPVQYRVGGPDIQTVRDLAQEFAGIISANPQLAAPTFDWNEPQRMLRVDVLQDKARQLCITSSDIASALNSTVGGATITQLRDATYLIDVVTRSREADRGSVATLQNMQLPTGTGDAIPLAAVANIRYELEQPTVWRRDRIPTITVRAGLVGDVLPATVVDELKPSVDAFIAKLPPG
ncbi:efflux RND transporter permease subunit, partial [Mesorhizobium sp. M4B.F.Ca.ET.088.02.2.1]